MGGSAPPDGPGNAVTLSSEGLKDASSCLGVTVRENLGISAPFGHHDSQFFSVLSNADEFEEYPYDTKDFPKKKQPMIFAECNDEKAVKSLSFVN